MTAGPIIIATVMRPAGETGVQTHFNSFRQFLAACGQPHQLLTPFSAPLFLVYPVFAVRKILDRLSGPASVWWYRHWHAYFLYLALRKRLQTGEPCTIYAQCPLSAEAALRARVSPRQTVIMVVHFNVSQADEWAGKGLIDKHGVLYRSIREFEARVLPSLDGLVFVSAFMQHELLQRIPELSQVATRIVPNFPPAPADCGQPPLSADLISIGTLEARKNQRYLLEILAELRKLGSPLTLTMIGDGPDRAMLTAAAGTLGVSDLVNFAGFQADAAAWINRHRALIHVARVENMPITLLEALARGRPLFATAVGGVPEILASGEIGMSLPLDDAPAAAARIAGAMRDNDWLARTGNNARQCYLAHFSADICGRKLLDFLQAA